MNKKLRQQLNKIIVLLLIISFFIGNDVRATNTHATDLELSSSQAWSIADAAQTGLEPAGDFTVMAWIKPESMTGTRTIVGKDSASNRSLWFILLADGSVACYLNDANYVASVSGQASNGNWTHVTYTYDYVTNGTSIAKIYINGVQSGSAVTNATGPMANKSSAFQIGAREYTGNRVFFDGVIDDVRFYNAYMTEAEVTAVYDCALAGSETNLVSYWRFDNDGTDNGPSNNDLTNLNSATFTDTGLPFADDCAVAPVAEKESIFIEPLFFN